MACTSVCATRRAAPAETRTTTKRQREEIALRNILRRFYWNRERQRSAQALQPSPGAATLKEHYSFRYIICSSTFISEEPSVKEPPCQLSRMPDLLKPHPRKLPRTASPRLRPRHQPS